MGLDLIYFGVKCPIEPFSHGQLTLNDGKLHQWDESKLRWVPIKTPSRFFFYDDVTTELFLVKDGNRPNIKEACKHEGLFLDCTNKRIFEIRDRKLCLVCDLKTECICPIPPSVNQAVFSLNNGEVSVSGAPLILSNLPDVAYPPTPNYFPINGWGSSFGLNVIVNSGDGIVSIDANQSGIYDLQTTLGYQITNPGTEFILLMAISSDELIGSITINDLDFNSEFEEGDTPFIFFFFSGESLLGVLRLRAPDPIQPDVQGTLVGTFCFQVPGFNPNADPILITTDMGEFQGMYVPDSGPTFNVTNFNEVNLVILDQPPIQQVEVPVAIQETSTIRPYVPYFAMTRNDAEILISAPMPANLITTTQPSELDLEAFLQGIVNANITPEFTVDIPPGCDLSPFQMTVTAFELTDIGNISVESTKMLNAGDTLRVYYVDDPNSRVTIDLISSTTSFTGHQV